MGDATKETREPMDLWGNACALDRNREGDDALVIVARVSSVLTSLGWIHSESMFSGVAKRSIEPVYVPWSAPACGPLRAVEAHRAVAHGSLTNETFATA